MATLETLEAQLEDLKKEIAKAREETFNSAKEKDEQIAELKKELLNKVTTDNLIVNSNIGVGVREPETKGDVKLEIAGNILFNRNGDGGIFTGVGDQELNRYLQLSNSPELPTASGLKAGGVLVSDDYLFANPGKNDLVVKGNAEIHGEIRGKLWYSQEYEWRQGQPAVKMMRSGRTVAFLTYVRGKFEGNGEKVKVYESGGYWYLGGEAGDLGKDLKAKARCIGMP